MVLIVAVLALVVAFVVRFFMLRRQASAADRERERSRDVLAQSESRYRLLFEHNPTPMWVYDYDTTAILDVNNAAIASTATRARNSPA